MKRSPKSDRYYSNSHHDRRRYGRHRPQRNPVVRTIVRTPDWMGSLTTFSLWLEERHEWVRLRGSRALHVQRRRRDRRTACGRGIPLLPRGSRWLVDGVAPLDLLDPVGGEPHCSDCAQELRKVYAEWAVKQLALVARRLGVNVEIEAWRNPFEAWRNP